jgi:hypothetical protein
MSFRSIRRLLAFVLLIAGAHRPAFAQLATTETEGVRFVYVPGTQDYLVPHAARTFLNAFDFHKKLFGFEPAEQVTVLMLDLEDSGNASATSVPRDLLTVQIAPLSFAFETIAGNDRMNIIMNHELLHIVAMDQASRGDQRFRRLFGGKVMPLPAQPESILYFFLTTPRVAAPRWFHEGAATFFDTWMAGGLGRAQSGYDEMVFRSMVRDSIPIYDPLGLVSEGTKIDFQLQINSYLYGTRFMVWLARTYGPEKIVEWVGRKEGSRAYYAGQFRAVFGTTIERAWARWIADETVFQKANLESIGKFPITPATDLTSRALGSVSRAFYDDRAKTLYAAVNYPGTVSHLAAISSETGEIRRLANVKGPTVFTVTALARHPTRGTLFYTTDNGTWRDLVELDPTTRRETLLQKDARIGDLAFNPVDGTLWGIRQRDGLDTIVRVPSPYTEWKQVHTFPYGTVVYDLDVSPDGTRIAASFGEITGKQSVKVLSIAALDNGPVTPVAEFDFGTAVPNHFVFSPDGRYLYGSSYYTGVSNIFRYEIETRQLEAVTNADTGFFRPIPLGDDELIVFRYTGEGFVPARLHAAPLQDVSAITFAAERLAAEHPEVTKWNVGSPMDTPFDTMPQHQGQYRLTGGLRRESFYPVLQGYKDSAAVGLRVNLSDPLQFNRLSLSATFAPATDLPADEQMHLDAGYDRFDWRARASLNRADFYDLFGPTKLGRKGYELLVGRKANLVFDEPRRLDLDVSGTIAGNLDRLPDFQNVPVDVDRLYTLNGGLTFSDVRNSLGSVDDETGVRSTVQFEGQVADGAFVPKVLATFDRGAGLPLSHSSVWLRAAAGYSPTDRTNPFANFFFGGFGNNYVDVRDEKRYREYYALPGAELNAIAGRNFVKGTVEWNLPPWRFRRLGTPGFYATWLRPALFVTLLATNLDLDDSRRLISAGAQVDVRFSLLSALDLTLSGGAGVAAENGAAPRHELMVSLKILR